MQSAFMEVEKISSEEFKANHFRSINKLLVENIFVCLNFCRHCVSAVSPPGTSFDRDIPHVAGIPGESQLPPGEGCYSCNVDQNGIPLARRVQESRAGVPLGSRRHRRHVNSLPVS